jgi:DNA-binding transcriptional ArsR family regulator
MSHPLSGRWLMFYFVLFGKQCKSVIFAGRNSKFCLVIIIMPVTSKTNSHPPLINVENLQKSNAVMRALAHPLRIRILAAIDAQGTACVQDIYETLKIEQSIASQQLRILRLADLVKTVRHGKFIHYELNYPKVQSAVEATHRVKDIDLVG